MNDEFFMCGKKINSKAAVQPSTLRVEIETYCKHSIKAIKNDF